MRAARSVGLPECRQMPLRRMHFAVATQQAGGKLQRFQADLFAKEMNTSTRAVNVNVCHCPSQGVALAYVALDPVAGRPQSRKPRESPQPKLA